MIVVVEEEGVRWERSVWERENSALKWRKKRGGGGDQKTWEGEMDEGGEAGHGGGGSSDGEPGRTGHLLLRSEAFQRNGTLKVKTQRVFCVVDKDELWCVKAEALEAQIALGPLHERARQLPTILRIRLEECVRVELVTPSIEESVEKMRLRKRNDKPLAFRLIRFRRGPRAAPKFPPPAYSSRPNEDAFELAADAGGSVRGWINFLQKARWTCGSMLSSSLDSFPEKEAAAAKRAALRIYLMENLQFAAPETAFVVHADLSSCCGDDLAEFLLMKLGLPPGDTHFVARATSLAPRTALSHAQMHAPLARWLQQQDRVEIEACHARHARSGSAGYARVSAVLRDAPGPKY